MFKQLISTVFFSNTNEQNDINGNVVPMSPTLPILGKQVEVKDLLAIGLGVTMLAAGIGKVVETMFND
ncbi:MAG: hypothetical protein LUC85_00715 [Bacteroidales bacterium]|nr:hypothetical protein [Bacteroidales bacterium]MCD8393341.1 hypothetical protein [Bacteroidales bacterium]